jgi:hypothetical protein
VAYPLRECGLSGPTPTRSQRTKPGQRRADQRCDPRGVTATKMSTVLAVAQWIVQTSGTALTGLGTLTGNPSRKKMTKQCPAAMASAVRVASAPRQRVVVSPRASAFVAGAG